MIVLNLAHHPVVENRAPNEQLNRDVTQRREGGFLMGIRILGVALVLSVSMLWAQGLSQPRIEPLGEADQQRMLRESQRGVPRLRPWWEAPSLRRDQLSPKWEIHFLGRLKSLCGNSV